MENSNQIVIDLNQNNAKPINEQIYLYLKFFIMQNDVEALKNIVELNQFDLAAELDIVFV